MGKKINLALSARYDSVPDSLAVRRSGGIMESSQTGSSENLATPVAASQQKQHVSALKRLGPVNPTPGAAEQEDDSSNSQATRFLVTVTNDRSGNQKSPMKTNESSSLLTRPLAPGIRRQPVRNPNMSSSNQGMMSMSDKPASSIEIIDLETEPEEPPRKVPLTQVNAQNRKTVNTSAGFGQQRNSGNINSGPAQKRFSNPLWNQSPANPVARAKAPMGALTPVQAPPNSGPKPMSSVNRKRRSAPMLSGKSKFNEFAHTL